MTQPTSASTKDRAIGALLEALANKSPTPGGGAVAALLAGLGAATAHMTLNYSVGRKALAAHEALHSRVAARLDVLRNRALQAADADAAAYATLNTLWKLPAENLQRQAEFPAAVQAATDVPMGVVRDAAELLGLLAELCGATNDMLNSDLAIAAISADAAARAASWNVRINLPAFDDAARARTIETEMQQLLAAAAEHHQSVLTHCEAVAAQTAG